MTTEEEIHEMWKKKHEAEIAVVLYKADLEKTAEMHEEADGNWYIHTPEERKKLAELEFEAERLGKRYRQIKEMSE